MTVIIISALTLGLLGLIFGLVLTYAGKKFNVPVDERIEKVRACLGGANCGACGFPGCDGFAAAVVKGEAPVNGCPVGGNPVAAMIASIMGTEAGEIEQVKHGEYKKR